MRLRALGPDLLIVPWWHPFFGPSLGTAARIRAPRRPSQADLPDHNVEPHESSPIDRWLAGYGLGAADGFLVHARARRTRLKLSARGRPIRVHPHPSYEVFQRTPADPRSGPRGDRRARARHPLLRLRPRLQGARGSLGVAPPRAGDAWDQLYIVGEFYEAPRPS